MATNVILPTNDDLIGMKNFQQLASIDLLNQNPIRTTVWSEKKFLVDLIDLYKSVQYQMFNIYNDKNDLTDTKQFRSGLELYDYIGQTLNQGKPYSCNVYFDYNKKQIVLMNNGNIICLIPSINENKKITKLEQLISEIVKQKLNEFDVLRDSVRMPKDGTYKMTDVERIIKICKNKGIACTSEINKYDTKTGWVRFKKSDFAKNKSFIYSLVR